jgi:hypothetical protein
MTNRFVINLTQFWSFQNILLLVLLKFHMTNCFKLKKFSNFKKFRYKLYLELNLNFLPRKRKIDKGHAKSFLCVLKPNEALFVRLRELFCPYFISNVPYISSNNFSASWFITQKSTTQNFFIFSHPRLNQLAEMLNQAMNENH